MKRWILRLYPKAWRERYAAEMEALLEDAPAKPADALDLLKGALVMQFAGRHRVLLFTLTAVLIPWAIGYAWWTATPAYRSEAVFAGGPAVTNQTINLAAQKVLSRGALMAVIERHALFETNQPLPMEDRIELLRKNTFITSIDHDGRFGLAFQYKDPEVARKVSEDLTRAFTNELQGLRAAFVKPGERVPINARTLRFLSLAAGLLGFLIARRYRRAAPVKP